MSENNQIWEYEELISRGDMNYETETSSSDEEIDDAVPEELEVQKSEEGFYSLA